MGAARFVRQVDCAEPKSEAGGTPCPGDEPGRLPLELAIQAWHAALPSAAVLSLRAKLQDCGDLTVGTACCGANIGILTLERLVEYWKAEYGLEVGLRQRFASEGSVAVQRFLQEQFQSCEALLPDTKLLGQKWAQTVNGAAAKKLVRMASVDIYMASFVCKSRAKSNAGA